MSDDLSAAVQAPRQRQTSGQVQGDESDTVSQEDLDSLLDAFRKLVQIAADTGRDWKLVEALLRTMIDLVLETQGDLLVPAEPHRPEPAKTPNAKPRPADTGDSPQQRLRPKYRLRLEAVIDSWSDDETADFLLIGLRQVQRLSQQGKLYYFLVNRKRRYPVWQFDRSCGVLGGVGDVGRVLPESWSAGRVYAFMTTRSPALKLVTPAQWLLMKRNPDSIVAAIADAWEQDSPETHQ